MTGRADRGEGRLGRKPGASSDVKDAHTPSNLGRAQNERHEVSRNVRKGSVVLGRRLPLKDESTVGCQPARAAWLDGRLEDRNAFFVQRWGAIAVKYALQRINV
jgi:hypothetical protein